MTSLSDKGNSDEHWRWVRDREDLGAHSYPDTKLLEPSSQEKAIATLLARADMFRDDKHWEEAAKCYRAVLDLDWDAGSIWVQYGHALKESGNCAEALTAYELALELEPNNADTYLQLGHLLKITNKKLSAIDAYRRALHLDPKLLDPRKELRALGASASFSTSGSTDAFLIGVQYFFDVSDIIDHFRHARTPTGIQRIVIAVIEAALGQMQQDRIAICALDPASETWKIVDEEQILYLAGLSHASTEIASLSWRSALSDVLEAIAAAPKLRFPNGSILITLGSPWSISGFANALAEAKRENEVGWVAYMHDLVPLSFPEFCERHMPATFMRWIGILLSLADGVLVNSECTRADLLNLVPELGGRCEVVRPNGIFLDLFYPSARLSAETAEIAQEQYVLFVGTIEPRKNHILAAATWRRLIRELGTDLVPTLVFAGKPGWDCDSVIAFSTKTANLDGKLKILRDVSDSDLCALYKHSLFTLYCSHYEGWGLPVTESFCFGKVPVVAWNSALIEAGGDHALFFESNSESDLARIVGELLMDRSVLAHREREIRTTKPFRSWHDVAEQILRSAKRLPIRSAVFSHQTEIVIGKTYSFGLDAIPSTGISSPTLSHAIRNIAILESMKAGSGWHPPEQWGARTSRESFKVELHLGDTGSWATQGLLLYFGIRGHEEMAELQFGINGRALPKLTLGKLERRIVRVPLSSSDIRARLITLTCGQTGIYADRKAKGLHPRKIGIGLEFLVVCREDDLETRFSVMEQAAGLALLE